MNPINTRVLFNAVTIVKNTTSTSLTVELNQAGVAGTFSAGGRLHCWDRQRRRRLR